MAQTDFLTHSENIVTPSACPSPYIAIDFRFTQSHLQDQTKYL